MPSWWEYLLGGQQAPVFPQGQPEPTPLPMRPMAVPPTFAMPPEAIAEPTRQVLGGMGSALQGIGQGALNLAAFPGRVMQAGMAGTPYTTEQMVPWAAEMATNMVGAGSPFAQAGAIGSAGGKPGIRAYHGSPHDYPAERLVRHPSGTTEYLVGTPNALPEVPVGAEILKDFPLGRARLDKIGTGEGAQAYGHGWYGAEKEGTAKSYRDALAIDPRETMNRFLHQTGIPASVERSELQRNLRTYPELAPFADNSEVLDLMQRARAGLNRDGTYTTDGINAFRALDKLLPKAVGKMYEVNIKAQPEQFLDWDKPMNQQPQQVRDAVANVMKQNKWPQEKIDEVLSASTTGQQALQYMMPSGNQSQASGALREAGIPGIRYLDQGSRADMPAIQLQAMRDDLVRFKKQGNTEAANALEAKLNQYDNPTSNYVVFNDQLIDILKKYGLIGMLGGGAPFFAKQDQQ